MTTLAYTPTFNQVELRFPAVMKSSELAAWCQVGKNTDPHIIKHFGLKVLADATKNHRFAMHDVMRKIISVAPRGDAELDALLYPLQKATWVSERTGLGVSSINAAISENRLLLPAPIKVTRRHPGRTVAHRRRWLPIQIDAYLRNDPIPFMPAMASVPATKTASKTASRNVFAAICSDNAEVSRQCHL